MSDTESLEIKKRSRRRLVGAVALALLAVIILPMVMDHEPFPLNQDIQVVIPDRNAEHSLLHAPGPEEALGVPNNVPVLSNEPPVERVSPAPSNIVLPPSAPAPLSQPATPQKPVISAPPAVLPPAPAQRDEANRVQAILEDKTTPSTSPVNSPAKGAFMLQLGAFSDLSKAEAMVKTLKAQNFAAYTEKAGNVTRVRVGPYNSRSEAEEAAARLKTQGHTPVIAAR